jgi:alpha-N-arabinofuranosidase
MLSLHVAPDGEDSAAGTPAAPLRTIREAARRAQPGDTILIHAGTYRERIDPPRGGESPERMITYCAAGDGVVEIKGSEVLAGWEAGEGGVWVARVEDRIFGDFHPYRDQLRGHWFHPQGRPHHPGAVYLDGHWLTEAATREEIDNAPAEALLWFAEVADGVTTFRARFAISSPCTDSISCMPRHRGCPRRPSRSGSSASTGRKVG